MKHRICLNTQKIKAGRPPKAEQIRMIADAGFDGLLTDWNEQLDRECALAETLGLTLSLVHAPNSHTELLWEEWQTAKLLVNEWRECIRGSAALGAPTVVLHPFRGIGREGIPPQRGIEHFSSVVEEAEARGVRIAVENCEGARYLDALLDAYADCACVGFCWDTGHEKCYNWGEDMTVGRSHRLIATHLNDNLGVRNGTMTAADDLHLLPFDGVTDWQSVAERLKAAHFSKELCFEVKKSEHYAELSFAAFVREAYCRAVRFCEAL